MSGQPNNHTLNKSSNVTTLDINSSEYMVGFKPLALITAIKICLVVFVFVFITSSLFNN